MRVTTDLAFSFVAYVAPRSVAFTKVPSHGVTLGCVNDDPKIEIGMHIFVGSKAAWEVMPEGVIEFEQGPPG